VDIDRFIARNKPSWDRLAELTAQARKSPTSLSDAELEELIQLYQRASAHLSRARTTYRDPALTATLTNLVAQASSLVYGSRPRTLRSIGTFFSTTFPAAIYVNRRFVALATAILLVPAVVVCLWLVNSPEALDASSSPLDREAYAEEAFEAYYSESPSAQFATQVGINNVYVSFLAFSGGAAAMVPGIFVLAVNGIYIGQAAAWMITEGRGTTFFTLIAPHGLLEITSIVLAGSAGLRLGWTLLVPGDDRTRVDAMAEEGRRAGAMVLGLVACFGVAALIEGFVTGSALAIEIKVAIGTLVWVLFVLYVMTLGHEAVRRGSTGLLGEHDRPAVGAHRHTAATAASVDAPAAVTA
jgi:uncharacterized membrane protein SpoIIM required for sporulation